MPRHVMIAPEDNGLWVSAKYEERGFMFAVDDEAFHAKMHGMNYKITKKEPVTLCGFDGFWYDYEAEGKPLF